jgi:hypothetical protein
MRKSRTANQLQPILVAARCVFARGFGEEGKGIGAHPSHPRTQHTHTGTARSVVKEGQGPWGVSSFGIKATQPRGQDPAPPVIIEEATPSMLFSAKAKGNPVAIIKHPPLLQPLLPAKHHHRPSRPSQAP